MQKMLSYVRRAVDHYHMIDEGDRIAVGVFRRQGLARAARSTQSAEPLLSAPFYSRGYYIGDGL